MGFQTLISIILLATGLLLLNLCSAQDDVKQFLWITPNEAKQNISQLIPAGLDANDMIAYVARQGGWLPGKAFLNNGVFYGYFSYDGQEQQVGTFEVLVVPVGTTSWIPANAQTQIGRNAVVGGSDRDSGETLYICRGWRDEGRLIIGRLEPSSGICYIPHHGEARLTDYEILVINAYGQAVGLSNAEEYQRIALRAHNEHRATHHVDTLNQNDDLNRRAVKCAEYYAAMRNIDHSCPYRNGTGTGENLYASCCSPPTPENAARDFSNGWYSNVAKYDYDCNCVSNAGHFTQMVWKNSRELGFGIATIDGYTVGVGLYYPRGNVEGQYIENVLRP